MNDLPNDRMQNGDPELRDPLDTGMTYLWHAQQSLSPTIVPMQDITERRPSEEALQRMGERGLRRWRIQLCQKLKTGCIYLGALCLVMQILLPLFVHQPSLLSLIHIYLRDKIKQITGE